MHYLFSDDDDQDVLTTAAISIVEDKEALGDEEAGADVEQRVVLVDMDNDGRTVAAVSSMSQHWQAVKTEITQAPSWGNSVEGSQKGLMMKLIGLEGRTGIPKEGQPQETLEELVKAFERGLDQLSEVLGKEEENVAEGDAATAEV